MEKIKHLFICIFIILMSSQSIAHDTTRIHPLISSEIANLIESDDSVEKAYVEIYKLNPDAITQRLYWGTDFEVPPGLNDDLAPYVGSSNVINGVIQEDVPVSKVLNHFHHATSGIGLTTPLASINGDPSSGVAMAFFNQAIDWYGKYTEGAKETAYFVFGQSLHHVEDMSSPAHIHNDPHLTLNAQEKDDYEGYYLPMRDRAALNSYFNSSSSPRPVTNPFFDIWDINNPNSLVRYIHNMTTYQATLEFPVADYSVLDAILDGEVTIDTPTPTPTMDANGKYATGELAEMFPDYGVGSSRGLYWEEDGLDELAHWRIEGVGDFIHQYTEQVNPNEWWPVEAENMLNNPLVKPLSEQLSDPEYIQPFTSGRYYIEQLASGNGSSNPTTGAVVPVSMRTNFKMDWGTSNPTALNYTAMWEIYAKNLLQPAVDYGAGFTQYWYDIANTPPYMVSVTAVQSPVGATGEDEVYSAEWVTESGNVVAETLIYNNVVGCGIPGLIDISSYICTKGERKFYSVKDRSFKRDSTKIKYIHDKKELSLKLAFNEPVKNVSTLRFGNYNEAGACIDSQGNCLDISTKVVPEALKNVPENYVMTDGDVVINKTKYIWTYTIPVSDLAGLNGKLVMTVKASDKNNHRGGSDGAIDSGGELDGTPSTPARRNTSSGYPYPWYQMPDQGAATAEETAYSYDYKEGDQSHVLLFDAKGPSAEVNVDLQF